MCPLPPSFLQQVLFAYSKKEKTKKESSQFMVLSIFSIILVYAFHALPAGHVTTPNTGKNSHFIL